MDEIIYMKGLTEQERLMFQSEFLATKKNPTSGLLLCLFLA